MPKKVKVSELVQQFQLEILAGEDGLKRGITVDDLYRPGLEVAGYFNHHPIERIQILGKTELAFLETLDSAERKGRMEKLCDDATPCIIITRGQEVPQELLDESDRKKLPLLRSQIATTHLISRITNFFGESPSAYGHHSWCPGRYIWNWHADYRQQWNR